MGCFYARRHVDIGDDRELHLVVAGILEIVKELDRFSNEAEVKASTGGVL